MDIKISLEALILLIFSISILMFKFGYSCAEIYNSKTEIKLLDYEDLKKKYYNLKKEYNNLKKSIKIIKTNKKRKE